FTIEGTKTTVLSRGCLNDFTGVSRHALLFERGLTHPVTVSLSFSRFSVSVRNGLQCPACYAPGSERCESDGNLRCTGGADQCAVVVGTLAQGAASFALGGCATRAACEIKTLESGVFTYNLTKIQCSPAPRAQTSSATRTLGWGPFTLGSIVLCLPLFLPALLGLFLC
uniref:UPAR/Ly6 domain-containing protein n=1 Tax=Chelonoidis abingdonii TaxID=106734 RepID=A0A8C0G4N4_CHEAB